MKAYTIYELRDLLETLTEASIRLNKAAKEKGDAMTRYYICPLCSRVRPTDTCPCDAATLVH